MAHTYVASYHHCIFSTKDRQKLLTADLRSDLWSYFGGIARKNEFKLLVAGGIEDHAHILISTHGTLEVSRAMQLIKGGSSHWLRQEKSRDFGWQQGFAAFSVSTSQLEKTIEYINSQEEHHKKVDFKTEYIEFLKKNNIEYDPRYIFD